MFITLGRGQGGSQAREGVAGLAPSRVVTLSRAQPQTRKPSQWIPRAWCEHLFFGYKKKRALEEQARGGNKKIEFPTKTGYVISPLPTDTPSIRTSLLECSQFNVNLPVCDYQTHRVAHWQNLSEAAIRLFPGYSSPHFTYPGGQRHPL